MNYTVIGQDGKKYGPTDADQIRQWIAQKRVDSRTPVYAEGWPEWSFLGLLPEFAGFFSGAPPTIKAVSGQAGQFRPTNQLAVWGLVCGILSWLCCCCCCVPFNLVGLVLSIIALAQINARPETQEGRGLAIAGIVLSATNLLWSLGITLLNLATNNANITWNMGQN
jgi:hypothetical protein